MVGKKKTTKLRLKVVLHTATHTHVPKPPSSVLVKTKGERSAENPGSFCWWQSRGTVAQCAVPKLSLPAPGDAVSLGSLS